MDEERELQRRRIVKHLRQFGSITDNEARDNYGINRVSAIIHILRHKYHYDIETVWQCGVNRYGEDTRYGRYFLRNEPADN